jgi:aldehyde dehydrogenase (NAD+)
MSCAATRTTSARWSRSKWARSSPKGLGEVQEMIDIADFAVGLSRQLYGLSMHSERPAPHVRAVASARPVGVIRLSTSRRGLGWNAMIAAVCGDCDLWKPSSETPLCAIAVQNICNRVLRGTARGVFTWPSAKRRDVGEALLTTARLPLISATGSCRMGRRGRGGRPAAGPHHPRVRRQQRHHRDADADLDLACAPSCSAPSARPASAAPPRAGCSCIQAIAAEFIERLVEAAYAQIRIGDPLEGRR